MAGGLLWQQTVVNTYWRYVYYKNFFLQTDQCDGCSLADLEELNVKDIFPYGPIVLTLPHTFKRAIVFQIWTFACVL